MAMGVTITTIIMIAIITTTMTITKRHIAIRVTITTSFMKATKIITFIGFIIAMQSQNNTETTISTGVMIDTGAMVNIENYIVIMVIIAL